jgi:hypothetical protein
MAYRSYTPYLGVSGGNAELTDYRQVTGVPRGKYRFNSSGSMQNGGVARVNLNGVEVFRNTIYNGGHTNPSGIVNVTSDSSTFDMWVQRNFGLGAGDLLGYQAVEWANVDGTWRYITCKWANVDGTWRQVSNAWANVDGTWRQTY